MTFDIGMPMVPELALFVLAVLVLLVGLLGRRGVETNAVVGADLQVGPSSREPVVGADLQVGPSGMIGWISLVGLLVVFGLTFLAREGATLFSGSFVNDGLAIFSKKLFVASAALSVLGSLTLRQKTFERRAAEYHFVLLASVLGMFVLASARELILLFVSFELMSIPLYVLTGFVKREAAASEAALKFFLVGTASSCRLRKPART